MILTSQQSSGLGFGGMIVIAAVAIVFVVLFAWGAVQHHREFKRAKKGRWMSWAEDPGARNDDSGS